MPDPQSVKLAVLGVLGTLLLTVICIEASKAATTKHWRALWGMAASLAAFAQAIMFGWFYFLVMR
jgi:hypothetical protein